MSTTRRSSHSHDTQRSSHGPTNGSAPDHRPAAVNRVLHGERSRSGRTDPGQRDHGVHADTQEVHASVGHLSGAWANTHAASAASTRGDAEAHPVGGGHGGRAGQWAASTRPERHVVNRDAGTVATHVGHASRLGQQAGEALSIAGQAVNRAAEPIAGGASHAQTVNRAADPVADGASHAQTVNRAAEPIAGGATHAQTVNRAAEPVSGGANHVNRVADPVADGASHVQTVNRAAEPVSGGGASRAQTVNRDSRPIVDGQTPPPLNRSTETVVAYENTPEGVRRRRFIEANLDMDVDEVDQRFRQAEHARQHQDAPPAHWEPARQFDRNFHPAPNVVRALQLADPLLAQAHDLQEDLRQMPGRTAARQVHEAAQSGADLLQAVGQHDAARYVNEHSAEWERGAHSLVSNGLDLPYGGARAVSAAAGMGVDLLADGARAGLDLVDRASRAGLRQQGEMAARDWDRAGLPQVGNLIRNFHTAEADMVTNVLGNGRQVVNLLDGGLHTFTGIPGDVATVLHDPVRSAQAVSMLAQHPAETVSTYVMDSVRRHGVSYTLANIAANFVNPEEMLARLGGAGVHAVQVAERAGQATRWMERGRQAFQTARDTVDYASQVNGLVEPSWEQQGQSSPLAAELDAELEAYENGRPRPRQGD